MYIFKPRKAQAPRRDCVIPQYRSELPQADDGEPNTYRFHLPPGTLDARMSAKELAQLILPHLPAVLPFMAPDYLMIPTDMGFDKMTGKKLSQDDIIRRHKVFQLHFSIFEEYRAMLERIQKWPESALDEVSAWMKPLGKKNRVEEDDIIEMCLHPKNVLERTHKVFYGMAGTVLFSTKPKTKTKTGLLI